LPQVVLRKRMTTRGGLLALFLGFPGPAIPNAADERWKKMAEIKEVAMLSVGQGSPGKGTPKTYGDT
jgi:hypothetical protein